MGERGLPRGSMYYDVLAILAAFLISSTHSQDESQCPVFREFDTVNPNSIQFGAPDGCRCVDGMSDLNCGFCGSDAPCKSVNSDHICRKGVLYSEEDTYKSYKCALFSTLETFFTDGKVSVFMNKTEGTGFLSVYNKETVNLIHAIDCSLTGCDNFVGTTTFNCDLVVCNCTDYCNSVTKSIIETMMSGKPAQVEIEDTEYNSYLAVKMEGAPMDIEALCNASACTIDPNAAEIDETLSLEERESEWSGSATFSMIVLIVIIGAFLLLLFCFMVSYLIGRAKSTTEDGNLGEYNTQTNLYDGDSQILQFYNINKTVYLKTRAAKAYGRRKRKILDNISGSIRSGSLMGIMGPSGAGKSSLLNVLAAVESGPSTISGKILLNGKQQKTGYRNIVAYVRQDDSLYPTLTVKECVEYSAMLRLPRHMTAAEKAGHAWKTLQELNLVDIAHSRIGSSQNQGDAAISGGERKRVSIGMELVAQASVLICDEPLSGLDSYAANQVMKVLSSLASRNRIVILSVHQPSMKSFLLMDQILLLGNGQVHYSGKPSEVETYLTDHGFPRPEMETVADHMLDVVSVRANCDILMTGSSKARPKTSLESASIERDETAERRSLFNEITTLFVRTAKDIFRNKELASMQLATSIALALLIGGIFKGVTDDLAGFQNRMGAFYFSLSFFAFASFSSMDIFIRERHIFVRESGSKYYQAFSYFLAKTVLDILLLRVIPATAFSFIFYWMMGLKSEPEAFIIFWATLVLFNICAGSMSICISIATPTVGQANLIAAVWFLIMLLFGGFLLNVSTMSSWYAWLRYASIFYYSFEIMMTNELAGIVLSFDAPGYPPIPIYGEVFLETIGMDADNQIRNLVCLCGLALGFCMVAYLLLLLRVPRSAARQFHRMQRQNNNMSRESKPKSGSNLAEDVSSPAPSH